MDFDNPKVYGDTFISDGLVLIFLIHILEIESSHTIMRVGFVVALTRLLIWDIKSLGLWLPCDVMF